MSKPEDFGSILNGVMWFQVVISAIFIGLRVYTRHVIIHNLGWDDILMVVNMATLIGYVSCVSVGITHGIGKKSAEIQRLQLDYSKAVMWEAIGQGICIMGIAASKGSVALFLLRIVLRKWHIAMLWFCITTTTVLCIITTTMLFFQCKPAAYLWDRTIEGGYCWLNFTTVGLVMGAWSATMDFALAILPWQVIMGLNMKKKEKITIACGLSLGVFAGACSIVRTVELQTMSSMDNYVYDTSSMLLWSSSEVCLTIICACLPVLRPLYVRIKYGYHGETGSKHSYSLHQYSDSKRTNAMGENTKHSRVYMGPGASILRTTVRMGDDAASEESILRECNVSNSVQEKAWDSELRMPSARGDIMVTTTVETKGEHV